MKTSNMLSTGGVICLLASAGRCSASADSPTISTAVGDTANLLKMHEQLVGTEVGIAFLICGVLLIVGSAICDLLERR